MSLRGFGFSFAALLAALGGIARADETITVKGQVTAETGTDIIFGATGSSLVGQAFSITYQVFDSSPIFEPFTQTFDLPNKSSVSGGYWNGTSPVLASLTIDGVTFDDGGLWTNGEALRAGPSSGKSEVYYQAEDANWGPGDVQIWTDISSTTDPFVTNADYRTNLQHTVTAGDVATGALTETYMDFANPSVLQSASLTLTPTSIFIDPPGVPEPATWTLMVLGVGAAGATLRRRRRQVLAGARGVA
ncbi:MAG TPA: PEPxxWA-CTERM sorting domain-containing protein [Caulobacteraceae bacterium]|jgi:hypothetical protein